MAAQHPAGGGGKQRRYRCPVIGTDGSTRTLHLDLKILNDTERKTLLAGSMINLFKESRGRTMENNAGSTSGEAGRIRGRPFLEYAA